MKKRFYKAAKDLGLEILSFESETICGCQEYTIRVADEKAWALTFTGVVERGCSEEDKTQLIELFKEQFTLKNPIEVC